MFARDHHLGANAKAPYSSAKVWFNAGLRLTLGGVLAYFVLDYASPNWLGEFAEVQLDPSACLVALAVVALASVVMAYRWTLVAKLLHGETLGFWPSLRSFLLARFLGFFISPVAMDLIGRRLGMRAQGHGGSTLNVALQIIVERWFDVLLPVLFCAGYVTGLATYLGVWGLLVASTLVGSIVGFVGLLPMIRALHWLHARYQPQQHAQSPAHLSYAHLTTIAGLGIVRWWIVIWHTDTIAQMFGLTLTAVEVTLSTATSQLATVIALTPGGLGIQEAGWVIGLEHATASSQSHSVIALAQRIGAASCFGILAALAWALLGRRTRGRAHASHEPSHEVTCGPFNRMVKHHGDQQEHTHQTHRE